MSVPTLGKSNFLPDTFAGTIILALTLILAWLILYGGADWIAEQEERRYFIHLSFEPSIPFISSAAVVYLSLQGLLLVPLFYFRRPSEFLPLFWTALFEMIIAATIFIAVPIKLGFVPLPFEDTNTFFYTLADQINLNNNFLPSLHVAFAFTAADAVARKCSAKMGTALFSWAGLISLSTLFTHQHHLLDILSGIALSFVAMRYIYSRLYRDNGWRKS